MKNFYQQGSSFQEFVDSTRVIRGRLHGLSESLVMLERLLMEESFEQGLDLVRIIGADLDIVETFFEEGIERGRSYKASETGVSA